MASESPRVQVSFRERAVSADFNRQIQLSSRNLQQIVYAAVAQEEPVSGVVRGLKVTVDAGARTATIGVGIALLYDVSIVYPDSPYRWIEVTTPIVAAIPAGSAFDRWDIVEISSGSAATITSAVDIWDPAIPPNGAFAPQSKDKEFQSTPIATVRSGADNSPNPPNFPTGVTAKIPLAYIYVDNAGAVTGGVAGIVQARPLLQPVGATADRLGAPINNGLSSVEGGGVEVATASATSVTYHFCRGRFQGSREEFLVSDSATLSVNTGDTWDGGTNPAGDDNGYSWAFPIPWPTGHDAMAGREFIVGSAVRTHFFCIDNSSDGQLGCGIIHTDIATTPVVNSPKSSPQGGGVELTPTNGIDINDWPFRTGVTRAEVLPQFCVYLGAFDFDGAGNVAMEQTYFGYGRVAMKERFCGHDVFNSGPAPSTPFSFDLRVPRDPTAILGPEFDGLCPLTANVFQCRVVYEAANPGANEDNEVQFIDDDTRGTSMVKARLSQQAGGSLIGGKFEWYIELSMYSVTNPTSNFLRAAGVSLFRIDVHSYTDRILAQR